MNPQSRLDEPPASPVPQGVLSHILVACTVCGQPMLATLSAGEYKVLVSDGVISRYCEYCGETTYWRPGDWAFSAPAQEPGSAASPGERRRNPRFNLKNPAQVSTTRGVVDFVQVRDASQAGLAFCTTQLFWVGEEVQVTLHFTDSLDTETRRGRITWAAESPGERHYGLAWCEG